MTTTPQPVVADTIGGGEVKDPGLTHLGNDSPVITKSYSRVFEHYVNNAMDAYGYNETATNGYVDKWMVDEGWQLIPYWNPAIAMSVMDTVHMGAHASAVKVNKLGFKVKLAMIMRQEVAVTSGVTTINNNFASQPYFEVHVDKLHRFDRHVYPRPSTSSTYPTPTPGYSTSLLPNRGYICSEVTSVADGQLPRVVWSQDFTANPTLAADKMIVQKEQGAATAWSQFSTLSEGVREIHSEQDVWGYEWHAKADHWYPIRIPPNYHDNYFNANSANTPLAMPTARDAILAGTAPLNSDNGVNPRGSNHPNCKHNIWQSLNEYTGLWNCQPDIPPDVYVKLNRLLTVEGPMQIMARLIVEYTSELSFMPIETPFTNNSISGNAGTGGGTGWFATSFRLGIPERFSSWGIPDWGAGKRVGPYQEYQPTTLGGSLRLRSARTSPYEKDRRQTHAGKDRSDEEGDEVSFVRPASAGPAGI